MAVRPALMHAHGRQTCTHACKARKSACHAMPCNMHKDTRCSAMRQYPRPDMQSPAVASSVVQQHMAHIATSHAMACPCNTMPSDAMSCNATLSDAMPCNATPIDAMPCNAIQWCPGNANPCCSSVQRGTAAAGTCYYL
eukprot:354028-Chlamydomonas_euryale.AAC.9